MNRIIKKIKDFKTASEINFICKQYDIGNYTINEDGSIDVNGNVNLSFETMTKIPLKFNVVSGYFTCYNNKLTSLFGCPNEVGGHFDCSNNFLTSLEFGPSKVGAYFSCANNRIVSLVHSPISIGGVFYCENNQLTTLNGCPKSVFEMDCQNNNIVSIEDRPEVGSLILDKNPISIIVDMFGGLDRFIDALELYEFMNGNKIIIHKFKDACDDFNVEFRDQIKGYVFEN